jgi:hypothetical protein
MCSIKVLALALFITFLFVTSSFSGNTPVLVSPPNKAQNVSVGSNLAWYGVTTGGRTVYTIQVCLDTTFLAKPGPTLWQQKDTLPADGSLCSLPSGQPVNPVTGKFLSGTTYYWRVNGGPILPWSTIWSFTTAGKSPVSVIPRSFTNRIQATKDSRVFDIRGRLTSSKSTNVYISKLGTKLVVKSNVIP